ncbi:Heparinase II/III-like protein [Vibrio vulnificus]|nr:Heparinase II/III-like protein [Vibrio vulnificus]OQK68090.1 Heparinase II/III-like protein [Vibrio vulnificus]
MLNKFFLYLYTLKFLKFKQVFYRLKRKLPIENFSIGDSSYLFKHHDLNFYMVSINQKVYNDKFNLLNEERIVDMSTWNAPASHLWLFNLHYFDYIHDLDDEIALSYISSWLDAVEYHKHVSYEPYVISLRLVNWIKFLQTRNIYNDKIEKSIVEQTQSLIANVEFHLLGNHLFANAKALTIVGSYLYGEVGAKALKLGLSILSDELKEQFLSDGAHFELSPMYNNIMLFDLLDIYNVLKAHFGFDNILIEDIGKLVYKCFEWSIYMSHSDGDVAFFNDSTLGISPNLDDIFSYASMLNLDLPKPLPKCYFKHLSGSGYFVVKNDNFKLIADFAQIGPSYLPGHAHADNLSFELDIGDARFLVNSGVSKYGNDQERELQRSTSCHNTVVVDNQNSSEMWAGFRVARRAKTEIINVRSDDLDNIIIEGYHDGYQRLKPKVIHTRKFEISEKLIKIHDLINTDRFESVAFFHFHPDVIVLDIANDSAMLNISNVVVKFSFFGSYSISLVDSKYYPGFGLSDNNKTICVSFVKCLTSKIEVVNESN